MKKEILIRNDDIEEETENCIYIKGKKIDRKITINKKRYEVKIEEVKYKRGFDKATSTYY